MGRGWSTDNDVAYKTVFAAVGYVGWLLIVGAAAVGTSIIVDVRSPGPAVSVSDGVAGVRWLPACGTCVVDKLRSCCRSCHGGDGQAGVVAKLSELGDR